MCSLQKIRSIGRLEGSGPKYFFLDIFVLSFPCTLFVCLFVVFEIVLFLMTMMFFDFNSPLNWVTSEQAIKSLPEVLVIPNLGKEKGFSILVGVLSLPLS